MSNLRSGSLVSFLILFLTIETNAWLTGDWLGNDDVGRTRRRPELSYRVRLPRLSVRSNPLVDTSAISHILQGSYEFTLPQLQLRRGTVYLGAAARLRRVVKALITGTQDQQAIKVGVIGGSISWGHGATVRGETDWFSVLSQWLISAFPRANITSRNGCTPGVPTPYMIMCLELSVDPDVDLVFMEYTLNDAHSLATPEQEGLLLGNPLVMDTERLLRRVLALPRRPAVVMLHSMPLGIVNYPYGHPKNPHNMPHRQFHMTSEDLQGALAQYYDVQYLSLRTAMYRLAVHKEQKGFMWEDMFVDHHPGDHGHKIMADLAVHMIQRVALGLILEPYGPEDEEALQEPLPGPMYPGNIPPSSPMCRAGDAFRSLVLSSSGFEYVNEGTAEKPKPGYVATQPGSKLRLRVDTDRQAVGSPAGQAVHVYLHHLRSYEHMGVAKMSCVSGCSCEAVQVDALITEHVSQVFLAQLTVSQARECDIEVEVLDKTNSGEHKFKVSGVVVAEKPAGEDGRGVIAGLNVGHNQEFGLRQHLDEDQGAEQVTWTSQKGRLGGVP